MQLKLNMIDLLMFPFLLTTTNSMFYNLSLLLLFSPQVVAEHLAWSDRRRPRAMELLLLNSLLMFDLVFMFFLFLVGVSCVLYYVPPKSPVVLPSPPPPPPPPRHHGHNLQYVLCCPRPGSQPQLV